MIRQAKLKTALSSLKGWTSKGNAIAKDYTFESFGDAFSFMTRCALEIQTLDHHPEWTNVYNQLHVKLSTHDAGGVTTKDLELAKTMDKIAVRFLAKKRK